MKPRRRDSSSAVPVAGASAALRRVPENRPDRVALARRLIADPNYPSRATLRRVAAVIARQLAEDETPRDPLD